MYRHRHAAFPLLSHSPPEAMPCLVGQAQEKKQHSRNRAGFRKHPCLRMTWGKNHVRSRECTDRQKESEKTELCNVKVESNGLALPIGQHTRDRSQALQGPGALMT